MSGLFRALGAQGPGCCQSDRGRYCIIHAWCLSDGKADQLLQGIVEFLVSSVKPRLSLCRELWGRRSEIFVSYAKEKQELKHKFNKIKPNSSASFLANYFFLFLLLFIPVALLLLFVTCSPDPNTTHRQIFAMEIPKSGMSFRVKEFLERIEICCSACCWASGVTWNAYKVCRQSAAGIQSTSKCLCMAK